MQTQKPPARSNDPVVENVNSISERLRAIAFNLDNLIPGFYIWFGSFTFVVGGETPDDHPYRYPGTIHDFSGIGIVLPGYRIWTTYKGGYDPGQASN